jgi:hypothetical protein
MANPEKLATLGTKNAGRRQTKQNHNIDVCQIVNQTDDSGNVNIMIALSVFSNLYLNKTENLSDQYQASKHKNET